MDLEAFMKKIIIVLVQIFVFSAALFAQTIPSMPTAPLAELGKWWKNSEIVKKLKLSDAQVEKIEQSFLSFRPTLANFNAELKNREAQLSILMKADPIDEGKIRAQNEFIAASRAELEKANSSMLLAFRKDLTQEQWRQLEQIQEMRRTPGLMAALSAAPKDMIMYDKAGERIYTYADPIVLPKMLYQRMPAYTDAARQARIEGIVLLEVIFRKDGRVGEFKVLKGLGYGLDESAINTIAKEWKFEPATLNGQPVSVRANLEVSFRLY
jgi:TonB family protein